MGLSGTQQEWIYEEDIEPGEITLTRKVSTGTH